MSTEIQLWIPGRPRAKGSYVAIQPKGGGRAFLKNADTHLAEWTNLIRIAWNNREIEFYPHMDRCFEVEVLCEMDRPKSHFGTGKNAKILKKSAPAVLHCTRTPDNDKVLRAILDALTGYAWKDDKQVVMCKCRKVWSTLDMTSIVISQLNDGDKTVDSTRSNAEATLEQGMINVERSLRRAEEPHHGTQVLSQRGQQRPPPS